LAIGTSRKSKENSVTGSPKNYQVKVTPVGPLQMNSVLVTSSNGPSGPEAMLIDPGDEPERLMALVEQSGCRLVQLVATHGHFDHVGAAAAIQEHFDLPLRCHPEDLSLVQSMPEIQAAYGFPATPIPRIVDDLVDGTEISLGHGTIKVTHVPGHSPGQIMLTFDNHAVVGDCLFAGSVGRTDLPGGSFEVLEKSIRESIYALADETIVVCGHGPDTTVGRERASNPFVRG
jgi:hydroxyacylglutathione hydrolase